jgi:replication-associated recombination protein RarA
MSNYDNLWIEKYRPTKLEDMCISQEIKDKIADWGQEIPHLLLIGNAGVGKTTLARILVQDILDCDYLYLNASDENGIDTIRTKVTGFVQTKSLDGKVKVVILDEADGLTVDGQKCLRNLMESYSDTARFILTGNYKHKISPAIQSRCQSFSLNPTLRDAVMRCFFILKSEGIELNQDDKKLAIELIKRFFPDIRDCIGELSKNCVGKVLLIKEQINNTGLCKMIFENVCANRSFETRKYLIENESRFNSDWDQLMVDLLNHIYIETIEDLPKKNMIILIAEHLDKATRVIDKEINFFACLLNLETV